jgi:ABC-type Co2+ transport system permease subunit
MDRILNNGLSISHLGDNAYLIYINSNNQSQSIMFNNGGIYLNGSNITNYMPLVNSTAYQTATLSNTFQQTGLVAYANIAGYSWTSTVNGASSTFALKTS